MRLVARLVFLVVCHGFVQRVYRISLADGTVRSSRALGAVRRWHFWQGAGAGPPASSGSAAPLPAETARSRSPVIPEIVTRFNCLIAVGQTAIQCRRLYLPQRACLTPRGGLLFLMRRSVCRERVHLRNPWPALGSVLHSRDLYCVPFDSIDDDRMLR